MAAVLIGVDWGTSSARAYRIDAQGGIIDTRSAPLGLAAVADGGAPAFARALDTLLGDWRALPLPRIASGMVGSRAGWVEAPYVEAPATVAKLAAALVRTPGGELAIVPGVLNRGSGGGGDAPDVMRGEETEIAGALAGVQGGAHVVLPGTHSKWVHAVDGNVVGFATWVTGELYGLLRHQSTIGALARDPAQRDAAAFAEGLARGHAVPALMHAVFAARAGVLAGSLPPEQAGDWLSGLLIGREVAEGLAWARGRGLSDGDELVVVGSDELAQRYQQALAAAGWRARRAAGAAARGLLRIAQAAQLTRTGP